jgi:diguanylate cyclase (GGDEF)-like protein
MKNGGESTSGAFRLPASRGREVYWAWGRWMRPTILWSLLMTAGLVPVLALSSAKKATQFPLEIWRTEQGLPQNTVNAIARTPDGYLWIGTQEGLARFDGVNFTVFDIANTPALRNDSVNALCAAPDGTLWIGTDAGVTSFKKGRFRSYGEAEGLPFPLVLDFACGRDGVLWVVTYEGLCRLQDGRFQSLTASDGVPKDRYLFVREDAEGTLWFGTVDGLILRHQKGRFTVIRDLFERGAVTCAAGTQKQLWFGTHKGLFELRPGHFAAVAAPGLAAQHVTALLADRQGSLWVGTEERRLFRVRGSEVESLSPWDGLPDSDVSALYEDPLGSLWIGTAGGGLARLKDGLVTTFTRSEGLSGSTVMSVQESGRGGLWVGTLGGGLDLIRDGRVQNFNKRDGLNSDVVYTLLETRSGTLWIGTNAGGLCRLRSGRITELEKYAGFDHPTVTALLEDRAGTLWIGTANAGLYRLADDRMSHYGLEEGLSNLIVHALLEDSAGRLWVGTEGGLGRLEDGRFEMFKPREGPSAFVVSLCEDAEGFLWVGTAGGGLNLFRNGAFIPITKASGLCEDTVIQILPDELGNFWMGSHRGIFMANRGELLGFALGRRRNVTCVSYGVADGMKSADCSGGRTGTAIRLRDGRLCFATWRGLAFIDPASAALDASPPLVEVENASFDGQKVMSPGRMVLPLGMRQMEFHYTAPDLYAPEKLSFRYRLEGFDADWVEAGSRRTAYYANLRPGRYTFRVEARNGEGVWGASMNTVSVDVPPYFYETAWAYSLGILSLIFLGIGAYHLRVRALRARQLELTREVERGTRELNRAYEALEARTLELESLNKTLERMSVEDGLTRLTNRRHFEECLRREWRRAERFQFPLALLILDVDYFKDYNDTYGHQQGDRCLQKMAARLLQSFARATDLPARLGGDEFCVILAEAPLEQALAQAEKLRRSVEALAIPHEASQISSVVTISMGVAVVVPTPGYTPEALLDAADRSLYKAKRHGRNRVFGLFLEEPEDEVSAPEET